MMKYRGLYLGSPCNNSWFEVDRWVIKIMNALGVAVPLALGENQWRCSKQLPRPMALAGGFEVATGGSALSQEERALTSCYRISLVFGDF
jgi:hypothetical protein